MTSSPPIDPVLTRHLPERRYLPELHGVRGLALLGVVLFHLLGNGRVSGGIDIFLAISGFLFTGMLLREASTSGGRLDLFKYFGRLFRRIFVPAALVAVATLVAGLLILPVTQHRQLWAEARASLLYFENLELINSQLAYGAAGPETSPFQHFWSLSVQGQFYLVWPFVAIISVLIAKRLGKSAAVVMATVAALIVLLSISYAIYVGSFNQNEAYLMTATRAWELAFGALLALAGSTLRLPAKLRGPAGWLGLSLIVSCGFILDGGQLFPGPWALWPLGGLTLIFISAGPNGGNNDPIGSATNFLSNRILSWIGDHAYGLYLWHWPLLIFYMEIRNRDAVGLRGATFILAISIVLAMIMNRFLERPLQKATKKANKTPRSRRNKVTVAVGSTLLVIAGVSTTAFAPKPPDLEAGFESLDADLYPGAAAYFLEDDLPEAPVFPTVADVGSYGPDYNKRNCSQKLGQNPGTDEVLVCEDEDAPENPSATIVLAGGSHAGHLEAAFKNLGRAYGWEVLVVIKSSCVFGWEEHPDQSVCGQWNENFVEWLNVRDVDLVVTPGTRLDSPEYILDAAPEWWQKISETGTELLVVRGTPRGSVNIPECLADGGSSQECGPSKERFAEENPLLFLDLPDNIYQVDVTKYVCPQIDNDSVPNCDAIVGNMIVWFDSHHLSKPFSHSLAVGFEEEMKPLLPRLFR